MQIKPVNSKTCIYYSSIIYLKAYFTIVHLLVHYISVNIYTYIYEKQNFIGDKPTADCAKGRNVKNPLTGLLKLYLKVSLSRKCARGTPESRPRNPRFRGKQSEYLCFKTTCIILTSVINGLYKISCSSLNHGMTGI